MDNLKGQKMTKRTEQRDNSPENTMPVVLTAGCQTIASNLLEITKPLLLQKTLLKIGDALPNKAVVDEWLFLPLPRVSFASHMMN